MGNSGIDLYKKAKKIIPGGTQLLSKRPEMYLPDYWPSYYKKISGVDIEDLDGNHYLDMTYNALGSCILGACDSDVDAAVIDAITNGSMSTLNCPEEVELAELLLELHPWANMVRYARCGGEAMAIAIRIARAASGKDKIAFCGYHGWHDWYLAANVGHDHALDGHLLPGLHPNGVPRALGDTAYPFRYNKIEELEAIIKEHGKDIGVISMEPIRNFDPADGFLERVREIANEIGAVLIFDEVSAGFRICCGGAHLTFGVNPDIAVYAKGMSNGYPMAAIIGVQDVMSSAQDTFMSSTYWTERIGPAAALATIKKHRSNNVHEHLIAMGTLVQDGWKMAAEKAGLDISVSGMKPLGHFSIEGDESNAAKTYFVQEMLEHGFLASNSFYATYAHTKDHVEKYLSAVEEVFAAVANALDDGSLLSLLKGPEAHKDFHRLT
ncbi:MAG: aminotransferase class III-fold pyridoxal phosphate-dependent enzyme [Candidatus Peribacteraceae bacterium]|jgi:glutamate-1-semialdehyde aminotransferase|nr:aminotransferase class III-fold pyridoxal phosphate-dependent enzyme [Candidatus Peribacteraceae bacterium]